MYRWGTYNGFGIAGISGDGKKVDHLQLLKKTPNSSGSILCFDVTTGKRVMGKGHCCMLFPGSSDSDKHGLDAARKIILPVVTSMLQQGSTCFQRKKPVALPEENLRGSCQRKRI